MPADLSGISVKAMVILVSADRSRHIVSRLGASRENPIGFDRLIGGHLELGERAEDAAAREVREELHVDVAHLELLDVVESIFRCDGELGHEVIFIHSGIVPDDTVPPQGATFAEADGSPLPVVWRSTRPGDDEIPLFPDQSQGLLEQLLETEEIRG